MAKVIFACDECGEDHMIDSVTKEVILFDKTIHDYADIEAVSYEEDPVPEEVAEAFNGFKWKCTKCGEEMEEEYYTKTQYYL